MSNSTIERPPAVERGAVLFEGMTIEYSVTRSPRRKKTIGISLDHGTGVLISAPLRISKNEIRELVLARASWIVQKSAELAARPGPRQFVSGEWLLYLGGEAPLTVEHVSSRRVAIRYEHGRFTIAAPARLEEERRRAAIETALVGWFKERAAEHLAERVAYWCGIADRSPGAGSDPHPALSLPGRGEKERLSPDARGGREQHSPDGRWEKERPALAPSRILIRNQRRRWGSCSLDGSLRFNWRIVMAPPEIVDYLVVHELAHLRVRNHSPAFWEEMARLMPDYQARRAALRKMESRLHI